MYKRQSANIALWTYDIKEDCFTISANSAYRYGVKEVLAGACGLHKQAAAFVLDLLLQLHPFAAADVLDRKIKTVSYTHLDVYKRQSEMPLAQGIKFDF